MAASTPPRYLLDTNILVYYVRGRQLGPWIEARYHLMSSAVAPLVCAVTLGEIWSLARKFGWGDERKSTLRWILSAVVPVPLDFAGLVDAYAEIDDTCRRIGRPIGENDAWIAATARATGAVLLTTDHDFDVLDPQFLTRHYIDPGSHLADPEPP